MNIAFTTPNYWPYVRRGTARYISVLTGHLIKEGHRVTIITSKPGKGREVVRRGYMIKYSPFYQHPLFIRYINRIQMFAFGTFRALYRDRYDVVYCMHFPDGFAAHLASRFRQLRYLLNITSVPLSKYWGNSRINKYMFEKSIESAGGLLFPSKFAAVHMQEKYGVAGKVIPMPVDMEHFTGGYEKDLKNPVILFVSDLTDRRKGLSILLQAFCQFRRKIPGAELLLAGQTDRYTNQRVFAEIPLDAQSSVKILGQGRLADLPKLYTRATMTVLPSMYEVFGMVLLESLASGTPVVGCNSGAIPEIITTSDIGRLFDPAAEGDIATNADGLYDAMMEVFEISRKEDTPAKCREYARQFDISVIGKQIEGYLESVSLRVN